MSNAFLFLLNLIRNGHVITFRLQRELDLKLRRKKEKTVNTRKSLLKLLRPYVWDQSENKSCTGL